MEKWIIRRAEDSEFKQIIELQQKTHFKNVPDKEKPKEGFVSVETTINQLKELNKRIGILVVCIDLKVIGYEMPLDLEIAKKLTILDPFIKKFDEIEYKGKKLSKYNLVIEGQINIDKQYKGIGIGEKLHKEFLKMLKPKYNLLITEVSNQNQRSLHFHTKKLGLSIIQEYSSEGKNWYILLQEIK